MIPPEDAIAARAASEVRPGMVVNLGVGLPCLVADHLGDAGAVLLHGENGVLGMAACPDEHARDPDLVDPGGRAISLVPGAATFDSLTSFCIVRGGHIDLSIVGGFEVDEAGLLANWAIPGQRMQGMGGAMDLVAGARRVIVVMRHEHRGAPKLVRRCAAPLTSCRPVDLVITELGVFEPADGGLLVREIAPTLGPNDLRGRTEARLLGADEAPPMPVPA